MFILEKFKDTPKSFKPISDREHTLETHNTIYRIEHKKDNPSSLHPEHNGNIHTVDWDSKGYADTNAQKIKTISDAKNLHNHALQTKFTTGDVIKNIPAKNNEKLKSLYKKAGFGSNSVRWNAMLAIVKKHPDDHEDEKKRGKNYLHPLEHDDVFKHRESIKNN